MRDLVIYGLMLGGWLCVAWYFAACNKADRNQYPDTATRDQTAQENPSDADAERSEADKENPSTISPPDGGSE